jgi:uncharacterized protein YidB (DUF937 family)
MARGFPSMTALLGMLAVAGYQHRDKLAAMLGDQRSKAAGSGAPNAGYAGGHDRSTASSGSSSPLNDISRLFGSGSGAAGAGGLAGILGGGLRELSERFTQNGQGEAVGSWIGTGSNRSVSPQDLEQAIGTETIAELTQQTGLSREDLLSRLSRELPHAVDQYTPQGRLPSDEDLRY